LLKNDSEELNELLANMSNKSEYEQLLLIDAFAKDLHSQSMSDGVGSVG